MTEPAITPLEQQQLHVAGEHSDTFWHRVRFRLVAAAARDAGATAVVDVGAGSGQLGTWLHANEPRLSYRFQEASPVLDAALGERFGNDRRHDANAPIAAHTMVTLLDVIEHVDDDVALLTELRERMAAGDRLFITVPAFQWAYTSWDEALGHHRRYSARQLRERARAAGLDTVSTGYLFPELLPLIALRKLRRTPREHADFPDLPRLIDTIAEWCSRGTAALRRVWPAGTSLCAVLQVPDNDGPPA